MKTTKMRGGFGVWAGMIMAVLAMSSGTAQADVDAAWKQSVTNGNWSLGSNWQAGSAATGDTGIATFTNAIAVSRTVTNDSSTWAINRMVFSNSGAFGWTITSNTLNLVGATPTITVNNISTATVLSVLSGSAGLIKDGAGQLTFGSGAASANTFTGGLTIKAGTVGLTGASSGGNGTITIGDSSGSTAASLIAQGIGGAAAAFANPIQLGASSGALTIGSQTGGQMTYNGGVTGANNLILAENNGISGTLIFGTGSLNNLGAITNAGSGAAGTSVTISSVIGGNVTGLTQSGINKLILSGTSPAFIGDTTLTTGTLNLQSLNALQNSVLNMNGGLLTIGAGGASTITSVALGGLSGSVGINLNNNATVPAAVALTLGNSNASYGGNTLNPTYSAVLSSANGAASLTKVGSNTQTLTGSSTYMGPTAVNGGVLELGGASGSLASTNLNLGGGTFSYTRSGGTQVFSNTTATAGFSAIRAVAGSTLKLGTLAGSGGTVDIGTNGTITTSSPNNPNGFIGSWATYSNGATWAVANGVDNAITGLSDATYTNTISAGTTAANYLNANIDVNSSEGLLGGVITPYGLRFNTAGAYTVTLATGTNTITSGGILVTPTVGANLSTITGGTLNGAASAYLNVIQNNTAGGLTISSIIADNTTATGLAKTGAGTLTLTGTNVYTGTTMIEGTLTIGGVGRVGTNGTYASSIVNNGAFVYSSSADQTLLGIISGNGSVTKDTSSSSTLTLFGVNTFTGGLFVKAGTNTLGTLASSGISTVGGSGSITLGDGGATSATLNLGGHVSGSTYNNPIILNGNSATQMRIITQGVNVTLAGTVSGAGNLIINNFRGTANGTTYFTGSSINIIGAITNTSLSGNTVNISGVIGDNVTGVINNSGSLTLGGANTYTGPTTLNGGTLTITSASFGSGNIIISNTTLNSFTFQITGTKTIANQISGTGGFQIFSAGGSVLDSFNTFTGANTYQGATVIGSRAEVIVASINSVVTDAGKGTVHSTSSNLGSPVTVAGGTIYIGINGLSAFPKLTYKGTGETTDRVLALNGASGSTATLEQGGTGLLKFISDLTSEATSKTLVLQGSTAGTGEIAGKIVDNSASYTNSLVKTGTGTWTLSGTNTYKGSTTVSNGTLLVNNTSGSGTGAGAVNVNPSATLGGVGTITGTVTVAMGGILAPGTNSAVVGTFAITNLVMNTNSVLNVDCVNGAADLVEVTGSFAAGSNVTVNVNAPGGLPSRVTLFHAPGGYLTQENLATWTKTGAQTYSRIIWDNSSKTVVLVTQSGTILSAY